MATIGIWKVTSNLKQVIDYTEDEEKTKLQEEFKEAMQQLLNYVDDENKNDDHLAITGLNCSVKEAINEMNLTKKIWNKEDGILGWHAFQSFEKNTITKEECHKIGVELANEIWGDRFQVIVSSHYNTEHYHNHFVVNSVSFKDGKKYYDNRATRAELRRMNDIICKEHGLEVLDEKITRRHIFYPNYLKNDNDKINYYTIAKNDIDNAILEATSYKDFLNLLSAMNYTVTNRYGKLSVRRNDYKRNIRIERFFGEDYSIENIKDRIQNTQKNNLAYIEESLQQKYQVKPKEKKKYHGLVGLYRYYCYLLNVYPNNIRRYKLTPAMRLDVNKMEEISKEAILLDKEGIDTVEDFKKVRLDKLNKITELQNSKSKLWYQYKKSTSIVDKNNIKNQIDMLSVEIKPLREDLKLLNNIEKRKNNIQENINEYEREGVIKNEPIK